MTGTGLELPPGGLDDGVVALRPYRSEDVELLHVGAQDADVVRFAGASWGSEPVEKLRTLLDETWPAEARDGRALNISIRDATTDELLGHLGMFGISLRSGRLEIGFWLRREARGRAAARRAIELVCDWAFGTLGIVRVQATTMTDNVATQRTLENAGFRREGVLRSFFPTADGGRKDAVLYARLATD